MRKKLGDQQYAATSTNSRTRRTYCGRIADIQDGKHPKQIPFSSATRASAQHTSLVEGCPQSASFADLFAQYILCDVHESSVVLVLHVLVGTSAVLHFGDRLYLRTSDPTDDSEQRKSFVIL